MRYDHIRRAKIAKVAAKTFPVIGALLAVGSPIGAKAQSSALVCPSGDSGITLPPGFCATVFADNIGYATTRARVSVFVNKFRKLGLIDYSGHFEIHISLLNVVLQTNRTSTAERLCSARKDERRARHPV
jgi:hypothetical protein